MTIRTLGRIAALVGVVLGATNAPVQAQTLGTFTFHLQPYCNVLTLTVSVDGPLVGRVIGFDDACGAPVHTAVSGSATLNADNTIGLSLFSVTADGRASHITIVVTPDVFSGPWRDNDNQSGVFAFGAPSPQGGAPRPIAQRIDLAELQRRVTGTCGAGEFMRIVNEDGSVTCAASATGDLTSVTAGTGLTGGGDSGDVTLNIAPGAIGAALANLSELQARVIGACPAGQAVQAIAQNGTVTCTTAGDGDITAVAAGAGLSGGAPSGEAVLAVAPFGIVTDLLADAAVTGAKVALPISLSAAAPGSVLVVANDGTGPTASFTNSNISNADVVLSLTNNGFGGGLKISVPNEGVNARGIDVDNYSEDAGVFVQAHNGNGIYAVTDEPGSAAIVADNDIGEAIVGRSKGTADAAGVAGTNNNTGYGVRGLNSGTGIGILGQAGIAFGTGVAGRFENLNATNTSTVLQIANNGAGHLVEASTTGGGAVFRVTSAGNVQADGAFTSPAADLAEFIDAVDEVGPADVVEIDPVHEGQFRLARAANSSAVAGVLATKPGVLLNSRDERNDISQGAALALAGRIPVKVSAENGPIRPGDLLVASSTPGHAMRAPAVPAAGTVVGKALASHDTGIGVIEMLVMLR